MFRFVLECRCCAPRVAADSKTVTSTLRLTGWLARGDVYYSTAYDRWKSASEKFWFHPGPRMDNIESEIVLTLHHHILLRHQTKPFYCARCSMLDVKLNLSVCRWWRQWGQIPFSPLYTDFVFHKIDIFSSTPWINWFIKKLSKHQGIRHTSSSLFAFVVEHKCSMLNAIYGIWVDEISRNFHGLTLFINDPATLKHGDTQQPPMSPKTTDETHCNTRILNYMDWRNGKIVFVRIVCVWTQFTGHSNSIFFITNIPSKQ